VRRQFREAPHGAGRKDAGRGSRSEFKPRTERVVRAHYAERKNFHRILSPENETEPV
jgi:hypothetical protein